jgi:hypothetical protein
VFKKKLTAKDNVEKYKPLSVTKDYSEVEGIDFGQKNSPISKLTLLDLFYLLLLLLILK